MSIFSNKTDLTNFEKLVLGFLFIGVVIIAIIKYFMTNDVPDNWVYIISGIGGLFTARKAISYFKPVTYGKDVNEVYTETSTSTSTVVPTQVNNSNINGQV